MTKLQKMLLKMEPTALELNDFIKEALLIERERDNWKKCAELIMDSAQRNTFTTNLDNDAEYWYIQAVKEINNEQNEI